MKLYKVYLDMSLVISRLKKYRIDEYNYNTPIVFVEADDPDEACFRAIYGLIRKVLDQDDSAESKELCKDLKHDIKIIRAST